jgi:serine/threonine protein kinase
MRELGGEWIAIHGAQDEVWWHEPEPLDDAGVGIAVCHYGEAADGTPVFVKRFHVADVNGALRLEHELRSLAAVRGCPNVISLEGVGRTSTGDVCAIFELADAVLEDEPPSRSLAAAVARDVSLALDGVHARGLVHADVAPGNVVRVAETWKLTDFENCVPVGAATIGQPSDLRYLAPGRVLGCPAETAFDLFGLEAIVEEFGGLGTKALNGGEIWVE